MQDTYDFKARIEWTEGRSGRLTASDMPAIAASAPPEFAGQAGRWTPEHLLVSSAASCLMTTFLAIAEISRLAVSGLVISGSARMEKVPGEGFRITEITLAPEVRVSAGEEERARRLLEKAERYCIISRSLCMPVRVQPTITGAGTPVAA